MASTLLRLFLSLGLLASPAALSNHQKTPGPAGDSAGDSRGTDLDQLVNVGRHRIHVACTGSGTPTVILESGLGSNSRPWEKVVFGVRRFARVCSYDRANLGRSDPAPRELRRINSDAYIALRSGRDVIRDLHTVLTEIHEQGPYVLVGHSLGGLLAILFASQYPTDTVGLVLVDSAHPEQVKRSQALMTPTEARRDHDGLMQNREGLDVDRILEEVRATQWRSSIPLNVLAHGRAESSEREERGWREMQADHAARSPSGTLIIAEKSGHDIHVDQPDVVVDAIKRAVEAARSRRGTGTTKPSRF